MNLNDQIKVQTERGNVPIEQVTVGDVVYEYNTGHPYEVIDIVEEDRTMYRAKYNDGRIMYHSEGEVDVLKSIVPSQECIRFGSRIANPLQTDAYTAGAFLVYGDRSDEYMNLPFEIFILEIFITLSSIIRFLWMESVTIDSKEVRLDQESNG